MTYVTVSEAEKYTTYQQFESLYTGLTQIEMTLQEKLEGGEDTPEKSTPIFGDIAIISANYDTSFFFRWECKDPRNRKNKFYISINNEAFFFINPWFNGSNYTQFIQKGLAKVGANECKIYADNGLYTSVVKTFNVEIPKEHVPQPPNISQDIADINGKPGAVITIKYTASDDGVIRYHRFYNGVKLIDITDRVSQNGTNYEHLTSWSSVISIVDAYIEVEDNEGMKSKSNEFKIIIT